MHGARVRAARVGPGQRDARLIHSANGIVVQAAFPGTSVV